MRLEQGSQVIAVHPLTGMWAVYREESGERFFAQPIDVRAFVVEKSNLDKGAHYLQAYDLIAYNDGLDDPSSVSNFIRCVRAESAEQAIEKLRAELELERKEAQEREARAQAAP